MPQERGIIQLAEAFSVVDTQRQFLLYSATPEATFSHPSEYRALQVSCHLDRRERSFDCAERQISLPLVERDRNDTLIKVLLRRDTGLNFGTMSESSGALGFGPNNVGA
jgi:hypothetical protein